MNVVIRVEESDRARAWAFLVRHSPGSALPSNTFIVSEEAARGMREAGIGFTEISRPGEALDAAGAGASERI
jgi:hypothetical protein